MDYDILFLASQKENSTKSLIIKALVAHQQLTNSLLQRILKKEFNKTISYQAIRQALTELKDKGALTKTNKLYSINPAWLLELKDIIHLLEKSIIKKQHIKQIDKQTTQITLKNMYELGHFILFGLEQKYFDLKNKQDFYVKLNHLWIPFADNIRRERLVKIFQNCNTYVLIRENTLGDRMLVRWYKKYCKVKLGVKWTTPCEYMIHGDCVVQIYIPDKLKKNIKNIYCLKNIIRLDLFKQITDMTYKNHPIQIIITRNKQISNQIKENIKSYF